MSLTMLRWVVATLACLTAGGTLAVMVRYLVATWRNNRKAPGRILARHVVEVSAGTSGLVIGYAIAIYSQLGGPEILPPGGRLLLYMFAMILLLAGVFDVGRYQRKRFQSARSEPGTGRHHI